MNPFETVALGDQDDIEFNHKDLVYARIDRRRKIHVTVLLKALGYQPEELLQYFYPIETIKLDGRKILKKSEPEDLIGQRCTRDVKGDDGKVIVRKDKKFTKAAARKIRAAGIEWIQIGLDDLIRIDAAGKQ